MNIYDIAEKAGVSIATVSRIINHKGNVSPKTQTHVLKVISDMGYTPNVFARALGLNSIKMVGVLCSDVADKHYAKAVSIIESALRSKGYDAILCCTGDMLSDKKKAIAVLLSKRVDALILVGSIFQEKTDNAHIKAAAENIPVVIINGEYPFDNTFSVMCDEKNAVAQCVESLHASGHKDILYMYDVESFSGLKKRAGFLQGLKRSGIAPDDNKVIKCNRTLHDAKDALLNVIDNGIKFTAIVTAEDVLAVGAMKALFSRNIAVPHDVAVIGFNNSVLAECATPALTSIDNHIEAQCSRAVALLLDVFEGKTVDKKTVIQGDVFYRESFDDAH